MTNYDVLGDAVPEAEMSRLARDLLDIADLRSGQRSAIQALAGGRDALVVMPTGAGKSTIYQLAGELREGPTLVVSPLLARQRDQIEHIHTSGLDTAAVLNSTLTHREAAETLRAYSHGNVEYLFLAPEQLGDDALVRRLRDHPPSLLVVDEAHRVDAWGHDFRPDYRRLGSVVERLGHPPVVALTATAAPPVRRTIVDALGLADPVVVVEGFERPDLWLAVHHFRDAGGRREALVARTVEAVDEGGSGIVYVATRRSAVGVADALGEAGVKADAYHAGFGRSSRDDVHTRFLDGVTQVVVATSAFGMGIDKRDVRFVFHHDVPGSVDTYYQELGQAGRDGDRAKAELFYLPDDLRLGRFFASAGIGEGRLRRVADAVAAAGSPLDPGAIAKTASLSRARALAALQLLERSGSVVVDRLGRFGLDRRTFDGSPDVDTIVANGLETQQAQRGFERSRVEMMRAYAETRGCRTAFVLSYFGQPADGPCGHCDRCDAGFEDAGFEEEAAPLPESRLRR